MAHDAGVMYGIVNPAGADPEVDHQITLGRLRVVGTVPVPVLLTRIDLPGMPTQVHRVLYRRVRTKGTTYRKSDDE